MERKKQIKFVDEMGNDSQDNMIYQSQMQDSALKPQHSSSMLDSQQVSPLKRKKSILVNRPSSPTEYEAMEQEMTVITRDNYVKHAEVDANKLECQSIGTLGNTDTKIFCAKFDEDDKYIAAACENGEVRVYNTATEQLVYQLSNDTETSFSYLKWRPTKGMNKTKNVFVTTNAEGLIQHWHLNSGKCLDTIQVEVDHDNKQLNCLDFNHDASKFIVCGGDPALRLYDEQKKKCVQILDGKSSLHSGHTNRVFCVKFSKDDPNIVMSGGWDKKVLIWDLRENKPIQMIFGPLITGDSIDQYNNTIITASWSDTNQLQEWNMKKGDLISNISWDAPGTKSLQTSTDPTKLYCCQFSKQEGSLILTGGSNVNEARLFDTQVNNKAFASIYDLPRMVYSVDFANSNQRDVQETKFAISGGDGLIRLFKLNVIA